MNESEGLWIDNNEIIILFQKLFLKMIDLFLIKKRNYLFFLNNSFYIFLYSILNKNLLFKINSLIDIAAIHYYDNIENEFELLFVNISYKLNLRYFFKILMKKENLMISLSSLYKSATWLEREIWDLFGIKYILHKDLRRILTDYGFLGHPLLKQFPLIGFIELRFDDIISNIIKEAVELTQMFRIFIFMNPWTIWNR